MVIDTRRQFILLSVHVSHVLLQTPWTTHIDQGYQLARTAVPWSQVEFYPGSVRKLCGPLPAPFVKPGAAPTVSDYKRGRREAY